MNKNIFLVIIFIIIIGFGIYSMKNYNNYDESIQENNNFYENIESENKIDYEAKYQSYNYLEKEDDGNYKNISEKMEEAKEVNGLKFENAEFTGNSKEVNIKIPVTVVDKNLINGERLKIEFYNETGEKIIYMEYPIEELFKSEEPAIKILYKLDSTVSEYWDPSNYLVAYDYSVTME